jgi:hypothetical protein
MINHCHNFEGSTLYSFLVCNSLEVEKAKYNRRTPENVSLFGKQCPINKLIWMHSTYPDMQDVEQAKVQLLT